MGNNLCSDKRTSEVVFNELKIEKAEKGENDNGVKPSKAGFRPEPQDNYQSEVTPEEVNLKVKAIQGSWNSKKTRDLRKDLTDNIGEIGKLLESDAILSKKSSKILDIQTRKPLEYEEELGKFNLHKNLVTLNPVKLHSNGNIYYGQWSKNKVPEGLGEMVREDNTLLEGIWKEGSIMKGRIYNPDGSYYEGEILNEQPHGKGKYFGNGENTNTNNVNTSQKVSRYNYYGEWSNGVKQGAGTITYPDGSELTGEFEDDTLKWGRFRWTDGSTYEGSLNKMILEGRGRFTSPSGDSYEGDWKANEVDGYGDYTWADGLHRYCGEYRKGRKEGKGTYYINHPDVFYKGQWMNGKPHGQGELHDGDKAYSGVWRYGKFVQILSGQDNYDENLFNFVILKEDINTHLKHLPKYHSDSEKSPINKYKPIKFEKEPFVLAAKSNPNQIPNKNPNYYQVIHLIEQNFPSEVAKREYDQEIQLVKQ